MPNTSAGQAVTAAGDVEVQPPFSVPGTFTIEELAHKLTESAGFLRNTTAIVTEDVADVHHRSFRLQLGTRVTRLAVQDPVQLLDELADLGFAWRDIARMIGISVPALRRWRSGERPTGENRRAIAQLLAFVQIATDHVFEPSSWMEMPISNEAPLTGIDLYADGHLDVVFDLATGNSTPDAALDAVRPGWREQFRSDWEVGTSEDGQAYVRVKNLGE